MATLKQFDPAYYMRHDTDAYCDAIEERRDSLDTKSLAESFLKYLKDQDSNSSNLLYEGLFAVLSETGGGKTFFLALLYCLLKKDGNSVYYIDTLEYIVQHREGELENHIVQKCDVSHTTVFLIDNIEKHSAQFILDLLYTLGRLSRAHRILCVLSYDDAVVQSKLKNLFSGGGEEAQHLFQKLIDVEFYLHQVPIDNFINQLANNDINIGGLLAKVADQKNLLSLSQIVILGKKIDFYRKHNTGKSELVDLPYVIVFIIIKLTDKKQYRMWLESNEELSNFEKYTFKESDLRVSELLDTVDVGAEGYGADTDKKNTPKKILRSLELTNVH